MTLRKRMTILFRAVLGLAVMGLALAGLGPILDHHFAERQHDHEHVYFNQNPDFLFEDHSHPYQRAHSHTSGGGQDAGGNAGIEFLARLDAAGQGGGHLIHLAPRSQPIFQDGWDNPLLIERGASSPIPSGHSYAPPNPPPRS